MFRSAAPPPGSIVLEVGWRDNPWFPSVLRRDLEYDRTRDPEKHAHIWGGSYVQRSEAQVFHNWSSVPFETPGDATFRFGADWGFSNDPTVLVRCFIGRWSGAPGASDTIADDSGRCLFVDHEAYRIGCAIDDTPALFAGNDSLRPPRWKNPFCHPGIAGAHRTKITADSARPETIDYMKRRGFTIEPAIKGPGSVEDGINFLKSYDIVVHPRCTHLIDELIHYSWATDRQTGEILPRLADAQNHVIDALRYALEGAHRTPTSLGIRTAGRRVFALPASQAEYLLTQNTGRGWGSIPSMRRGIMS